MHGALRFAALVVVFATWLAAAGPAGACSCAPVAPQVIGNPEYTIFTGEAQPKVDVHVPMVVTAWYQGVDRRTTVLVSTGVERFADGSVAQSSCGRELAPGPWIVVGHMDEDGTVDPGGGCTPTARLDSAEGQRFLAEVSSRLPAQPPPAELPRRDAPETGGGNDRLLLYVGAPLAIGASLFVVLYLIAKRRAA